MLTALAVEVAFALSSFWITNKKCKPKSSRARNYSLKELILLELTNLQIWNRVFSR